MAKKKNTSDKAVIIHGPADCGKSKYAEALCTHYGKAIALDFDHDTKPLPPDAIIFLREPNPNFPQAIAFADAMRAAGLAE